MGLFHLVEGLPHLLGPAAKYPILLNLATACGLFACAFVPAFALILLSRNLPVDARSQAHRPSTTGVPYWAQPLLLLVVFPLSWIWELLDGLAHREDVQASLDGDRLLFILPCFLIVVAVHEMGHIFAAKAVGFRIHRIRLGPFVLFKRSDCWRARFDLASEIVKNLPASVENLRSDLLFVTAAGPAASLLFALVTVMAIMSVHGVNSALGNAFGVSATLSFLVFAASIWPARAGNFMGDGASILALLLRATSADRICASYACAASLVTDRRPRDWDAAWVSALIADGQPVRDEFSGSLLAYINALDSGRMAIAGALLDRAAALTDQLTPAQTHAFFLESAYFEARHRDNAAGARQSFERAKAPGAQVESFKILRSESAVLLAEGRNADACRVLDQATKALGRADRTGDMLAEYDLVRDLKTRLESLQVA